MATGGSVISPTTTHARYPTSTSTQTSFSGCPQCSPPQREGGNPRKSRNLIVCIDGTSNQFGQNNTNVVKLFAKIDLESTEPEQLAYYSSGIGTRPKSMHIFDRMERAVSDKFDMAVAWNMEEIVKDAYGWLARMYQEGDKIYLFGFSRGAYQVRVLAGMIHEVGLIRTPTEKQIGTAYDHYELIRAGKPKTRQIAREFKNTFSWKGLRVHFIGVWDTVSSVGLIRGDVFLSTSSSAAHACHFRHALALDELRVKFMPEYFHEMNSQSADVKSKYVEPLDIGDSPTSPSERRKSAVGNNEAGSSEATKIPQTDGMKSKDVDTSPEAGPSTALQSKVHEPTIGKNGSGSSGVAKILLEDDMKSRDVDTSSHAGGSAIHPNDPRKSIISNNGTNSSGIEKRPAPDIKEVWFAGSHSDVGGKNRPGRSPQAGNVSLLWMRREAIEKGLALRPTDVVWVPDDLDLGINNSIGSVWRIIEYIPIKHQVSFSGFGEDARRVHRMQPRRIIPGQKVHASILYANAYKPQATLGEGFDIPITHAELDDDDLGNSIWETGLFDNTAAQEIVNSLDGQQGVTPIYLDRLLFMLRFKEGKECVRNVPGWQDKFENLIENRDCAPLVRLVTIVAYYEASSDPQVHPQVPAQPRKPLSQDAFDDAMRCLIDILKKHKHRDGPRVVALLRPLTRHKDLRDNILTQDILDKLVDLLDKIVEKQAGSFGQAMDGLNSLLQCEKTQRYIILKLGENYPGSSTSRLSRILKVKDARLLIAALRMMMTLARFPEARHVCSAVKPRIVDLAGEDERMVGLLAVEIWLALYDPNPRQQEQAQLNLHDPHVRANLASALVRMNFNNHSSSDGQESSVNPGQQIMIRIFGLNDQQLGDRPKKLIRELKSAVRTGKSRERTAATMTLLKLCETPTIREYLRDIDMMVVFIKQLQDKDAALLAAYALTTCLKYSDMREVIIRNELLPKYIVGMLRLDYFDDAVGQVEGFQIFGNIMRDAVLREKIKEFDIPEVLERKLGMGKPKEIRTSLICLDIFRSFDQNGSGARELVEKSLGHLRHPLWKVQKVGVTILSALAQTEHGVEAITPRIHEIIEMLLPEGYLPIPRTAQESTSPAEVQTQDPPTEPTDSRSTAEVDALSRPSSWMMGPASALRILAQNDTLRECTARTIQYNSLKHLYLSGTLVGEKNTPAWRIRTPNLTDVTGMLDKTIKAVDGELSEEGLMSIGDTVLPQIRHWDRLVTVLRNRTLGAVTILPGILGVSVLAILGVVAVAPIYLSVQVYGLFEEVWSRYQNIRFLDGIHDAARSSVAHAARVAHGSLTGHVGQSSQDAV